jgi:hypothetical protein
MTAPVKPTTLRQRAYRERKAAAELAEVRGIFAPVTLHAKIKQEAAKLMGPDAPTNADDVVVVTRHGQSYELPGHVFDFMQACSGRLLDDLNCIAEFGDEIPMQTMMDAREAWGELFLIAALHARSK